MKLIQISRIKWDEEITKTKTNIFSSSQWIELTTEVFVKKVKYFKAEINSNYYLLFLVFNNQSTISYSIGFIGYEGIIPFNSNNLDLVEVDLKLLTSMLKEEIGVLPEKILLGLNNVPKLYNIPEFISKVNSAQVLDISKDVNYIFENLLSSSIRTAIKRTTKDKVYIVKKCDHQLLLQSFELLKNTQKLVGASYITPYKLFQSLSYSPFSQLFIARLETNVIAIGICLFSSEEAFFLLNGWNRSYASSCSNQLLIWEMIKAAKKRNINTFNLGISHSDNLKLSKLKWGASNFYVTIMEKN
ncbi:MAG: GNAT family N-acetyltransferase [Candidatus Tisiphia sp.]